MLSYGFPQIFGEEDIEAEINPVNARVSAIATNLTAENLQVRMGPSVASPSTAFHYHP